MLLEVFEEWTPYTPVFLRKSAERIEGKGDVKHSLGKERKERRKRVPKREKKGVWIRMVGIGEAGAENPQCIITWRKSKSSNTLS